MEPFTILTLVSAGLSWVTWTAAGGALESVSDRAFCALLRGTKDRIGGLRGLPENHDVARAVRTAQIQALERLVSDYRGARQSEWSEEPHTRPDIFFQRSSRFIAHAIGRSRELTVALNVEVTTTLAAAIDTILAPQPRGESAHQRAAAVAQLAEDAG